MPLMIEFDTDNENFADGNGEQEVIDILEFICGEIEEGQKSGNCRDANGNKIGTWKLTIDAEE